MVGFLRLRSRGTTLITWQLKYLRGSCECISMGRGVPPGPPRVSASMKPRTTALLRAVPNSSSVYLDAGRGDARNAHVLADNMGSLPKGKRLRGCLDSLAAAVFCQRLNNRRFWNKIVQTTVDSSLSLNILAGRYAALDTVNAEHRWKYLWVMREILVWARCVLVEP